MSLNYGSENRHEEVNFKHGQETYLVELCISLLLAEGKKGNKETCFGLETEDIMIQGKQG